MDLPSAQQLDNAVADFLQPQRPLHYLPMIARHGDHVLTAQKVRRVQHVDVQGVALDPFSAVEQAAQQANAGVDANAQRALDGVNRAHLIRDRTDAADAGGDVGRFREVPAAQQGFEEAGRLVDLQLHVGHAIAGQLDVERAFAFHAGEGFHMNRF